MGIVKLFCKECRKEIGGQSRNHSKTTIQIFFSNSKRSHLQSAQHVKSWCRKHNLNYLDHPQSEALKGKTVVLTVDDYRKLMREGVEIIEAVNADLGRGHQVLPYFG